MPSTLSMRSRAGPSQHNPVTKSVKGEVEKSKAMENDSFEAVKAWLDTGNDPKTGDIGPIAAALEDIHYRWRKVLCVSPTVTMSHRMQLLMTRAGCVIRKGKPV